MDLLTTDPMTGKTTGLAKTVRRALKAMKASGVPFSVIGATALAVRGLPRMTRDLDLAVLVDDGAAAVRALRDAGFKAVSPVGSKKAPEPLIRWIDPESRVEVDLLVAAGDPESTVIEQARPAKVFGASAPVASLEHLLLLYLYSNEPKHIGDFAAIVRSGRADLAKARRILKIMHPEMVVEWTRRIAWAQTIPEAPRRPPPRKR